MRVRAFTNRGSTTKVIGKFPSFKTGNTVWWESQLERDLIYLLEFDPDVLAYREQPLRIGYSVDGTRRSYTPDFLVERKVGRQIIEVKYEADALKLENERLFKRVAPICREEGYEFIVATEREIRRQPRLDNIKLLWRYKSTPVDPQHIVCAHELVRCEEQTCLADLFTFFENKSVSRAIVYALIYRGELNVDLMQPLNAGACVLQPKTKSVARRKVS